MKVLKITLIVVGIIVLIILAGFLFPGKISVERSITIKAPVEMVYDQVNNLHFWEKWSPWHKIDTAMGLTYNAGGIGKGASYTWTSNHKSVGNGTLTIIDSKPFEFINTEMDFGEQGKGSANFKFIQTDNGVVVSWDMHSDIGNNPIGRWFGLLMKGSIENAYDRGLADIAAECDYLQKQNWFYVKVKEKPEMKYYGIGAEVPVNEIDEVMQQNFSKVFMLVTKAGVELNGMPFAVYHTWGETSNFDCAVPVVDNSKEIKGVEAKLLPAATYAALKYTGGYHGLEAAHWYLDGWLKKSDKEITGSVLEVYKTDPMQEPDSTKWVTYILYPIK